MSSYEVEHSIPTPPTLPTRPRIDFSTFFSALQHVDTHTTANTHAVPIPDDVAAAHRLAAEGYGQMRVELGGEGEEDREGVLGMMIGVLLRGAERPPREVGGVSDGFLDELERVPKKSVKPSDECPICGIPFLDDPYPLIVRLSCHKSHIFDLDCIAPWLKLHATCPLDRKDLLAKKVVVPVGRGKERDREKGSGEEEDEEEEWDEMYA